MRNLLHESTASLEVEACVSLGIRRQSEDLSLNLSSMSLQREDGCVAWRDTKTTVRCDPKENHKQMMAHSVQGQEPASTTLI